MGGSRRKRNAILEFSSAAVNANCSTRSGYHAGCRRDHNMTIVLRLFVIVMVAVPVALAASCPSGQPKTEAALLDIEQTWAKALQQHDADAVGCLVGEEFEDAGVDGSV